MNTVFVWTVSDFFGLAIACLLTLVFIIVWASDKYDKWKSRNKP